MEQIQIQVGAHSLTVAVPRSLAEKRQGLLGQPPLNEQTGMLFLFDPPEYAGVGMADMTQAISVGFISPEGLLLSWHDLAPGAPVLQPPAPVRGFVEVALGWFERHGLQAGALVQIPDLARWIRPPRQIGFRLPSA